MNEVKPLNIALPSSSAQRPSSATGTSSVPDAGNSLPPPSGSTGGAAAPAKQSLGIVEQAEQVRATVEQAVAKLNDFVQSSQRDLHFAVDSGTGRTIVTVVDRETQEVIRQIPPEVALHLAQKLNDEEPLQLFSARA